MPTIFLHDLVVQGRHGVKPEEKTRLQPFQVSVEIETDTTAAQTSDHLEDTIDYRHVRSAVIDVIEHTSFDLIEMLAQTIAYRIIASDERIQQVSITLQKPQAFTTGIPGIRLSVSRHDIALA